MIAATLPIAYLVMLAAVHDILGRQAEEQDVQRQHDQHEQHTQEQQRLRQRLARTDFVQLARSQGGRNVTWDAQQ